MANVTDVARFKPLLRLPPRPGVSDVPKLYRVLCSRLNCRGQLGTLDCFENPGPVRENIGRSGFEALDRLLEDCWKSVSSHESFYHIGVPAGYVRSPDAAWRLGRHAARRHDHAPRRPRWTPLASDGRAYRRRDGELILPGGVALSDKEEMHQQLQKMGMKSADMHWQYEPVSLGEVVTIECSRCHTLSHFVVRPSAEVLKEVNRRKHSV